MNQPELGKLISTIRIQKKLTQEALAEKCKVNLRTIQRIESGYVKPRLYTLQTISDALNFDFQLSGPESEKQNQNNFNNTIASAFVFPKVGASMILIFLIVKILSLFLNDLFLLLPFYPGRVWKIYTLFTYTLLHSGFYHLFLSSLHIFIVCAFLEKAIHQKHIIILIITSIPIGALIFKFFANSGAGLIGSGFLFSALIGASASVLTQETNKGKSIKYVIVALFIWEFLLTWLLNYGAAFGLLTSKLVLVFYGFLYMWSVSRLSTNHNSR